MNAVLFVTALASAMMFFLFFVLPGLDRAGIRDRRQVSAPAIPSRRSAKPAH